MSIRPGAPVSFVYPESVERRPMSLDEFLGLPEGIRAEYVDGVAIVSPPPELSHQVVAGRLIVALATALTGLDVLPEAGLHTVREGHRIPDVMALRRVGEGVWAEEPPVVAVEILSPSTRAEDLFRKPDEYRETGVEQYWIVDRDQSSLTVLGNVGATWDVVLELDADHPRGEVQVGEYGVVVLDLGALLEL